MTPSPRVLLAVAAAWTTAAAAEAQPLGTFRWQLQPFCNAVIVNVTQTGAVYTADGYDDQCGAAQRAPVVGLATPNPDGSIGFGFNVVTVPGGRGVQIDARISLATLSGTWSDGAGNSGTFAFNASTGGNPRPAPSSSGGTIPPTFALLADGGFLARGAFGSSAIPATNVGTRMMWYPGKAAFRAGRITAPLWEDALVGAHSAAFGFNSVANGEYGFAAGNENEASGSASTAFGRFTRATGSFSTAIGSSTIASGTASFATGSGAQASGQQSVAFGQGSLASGTNSFAAGVSTLANGVHAVAFGNSTNAAGVASFAAGSNARALANNSIVFNNGEAPSGAIGSFVFGDTSTSTRIAASLPHQFIVRASGGVGFYTNSASTLGVELAINGSSWASLSDVNAKENFRDVSGEGVLAKLAAMSIQEWNYKAQDASIRHIGPTAQDFRAAFGVGDFALRINTVDADGIALLAVKALEARTSDLRRENDELRARLARLEAALERR